MGCGFCEAALSNTVGTLVVDCVVKPVGRQLDYVRCFHDNVEKLREKKRELADARVRLLHKIEDAKNRLLLIENDVQNLQSRADETLSDMGTLEEEIQLNKRCLNWCPNWSWRYQLSKKAMKKIQDISELLDKFGQLGPVGYPAPTALPTIDFLCSKEFVFSKSSETAFYQIIEALKDENINMIGLWGMGGVGKTTLAHEVGSQAQKLNLFDKVAITVVSQKPNFEKIQDQIAQYIGFDMKNEQGRRSEQELWLRLKNEPRILIILDDIWESINLKEKIGIPIGDDHKGCKVLLTTRRHQVCQAMDCQNVVQLGCLNDDEAWTLFEKKAGLDDFSDDSIKSLANQIVRKCGGLPIAIVPLGSALKGKTHHEWQAAYRRLKDRRLTEIEDVNEENAYVCLEASFDYLKNMETKTCFLLCSLFPEDDEIYVENLVGYAWGLELYKGMDSIKDVRSEVLASIETLKNSGLLLDYGERHVKMHDVVRQFALWIASSRKDISFGTVETLPMDERFKHYTAISFETDQTDELPKGVGFPSLKLLLLGSFMETSSKFFEGMKALQVCALKDQFISVAAFKFNMNLQTLCLIDCRLSDISMLGKLKSLHILSLSGSDIIELPTEAGDLENLRLLDLSYCYDLQGFPPNLIQRLSDLEELYLHGCSSLKWATENSTKKESYSSLSELNSLPKLVVISLDISSEHLPDGFVFRRLWSFNFCIGIGRATWLEKRETFPISRSLRINKSVDACKQLLEDVESLELGDVEGHPNLIPSLDLGFRKLTSLDLRECHSMQCLIDASKQQVPITALSNLRKLSLSDMFDLEEMCNAPQPQGFLQKLEEVIVSDCGEMQVLFPIAELRSIEQEGPSRHLSLQSLKIVEIEGCNNLKYIFPRSVANSLGQLHTLKIKSCSQLEDIIEDRQVEHKCLLQSLRKVSLIDLPQLKGRDVNVILPTQSFLQKLKVHNCPQLTHFIISTTIQELVIGKMTNEQLSNLHSCKYEELEQYQTSSQHHPLPICFPNLIRIDILECESLKSLFPIIVAQGSSKKLNVPNLQTLRIERCFGMEEIIQDSQVSTISFQCLREVQVTECNKLKFLFPICVANSLGKLQILKIERCFGMEEIIQDSQVSTISFQCLREVQVTECNKLKFLFPICVANSLGKLQTLKIERCFGMEEIIQDSQVSTISFQCLREVQVTECNKLKFLFPTCVANSLGQLQTLRIESCSQLQDIIQGPKVFISMAQSLARLNKVELINLPQLKGRDRNDIVLTSPSLHMLRVRDCPQLTQLFEYSGYNVSSLEILSLSGLAELRVIWSGPIQVEHFQNLTQLTVRDCRRLRYIFSRTIARNLPQLRTLIILDCEELEQIIEEDQTPSPHYLQPICFPNLSSITIITCVNLTCLFPITLAHGGLPKLNRLELKEIPQLYQVFGGDDVSEDEEKVIHLPRLTHLKLDWLPYLFFFSPLGYHFIFQSLCSLAVVDCPNIITRFSVDSKDSVHAKTQASQSVDEIIVEDETAWSIGSDVLWWNGEDGEDHESDFEY